MFLFIEHINFFYLYTFYEFKIKLYYTFTARNTLLIDSSDTEFSENDNSDDDMDTSSEASSADVHETRRREEAEYDRQQPNGSSNDDNQQENQQENQQPINMNIEYEIVDNNKDNVILQDGNGCLTNVREPREALIRMLRTMPAYIVEMPEIEDRRNAMILRMRRIGKFYNKCVTPAQSHITKRDIDGKIRFYYFNENGVTDRMLNECEYNFLFFILLK